MDKTSYDQRRFERRERRRRRLLSFRNRQVPVRALVPNMVTLLGLCAGLTAIRMAIESRYDMALALIVLAAMIDGIDGRLARMLKAQSRFGAELDSLADFVNFGVAPAVVIFTWGLGGQRSFGWIVVMVFAVACGLRLARFNAALDVEKPRWQSNYFTGMPAPAGAMTVLLPLYLDGIGLFGAEVRSWTAFIVVHTLAMGFLMVSTIPTFSGKLTGERIGRDYVLPVFFMVALLVALLVTYPYVTLALCTIAYLGLIPFSVRRHGWHTELDLQEAEGAASNGVDTDHAAPARSAMDAPAARAHMPPAPPAGLPGKDETRH